MKEQFGDWRDLPEKNEKQCEFCNRFFLDLERHKEKVHGGKAQKKLFLKQQNNAEVKK